MPYANTDGSVLRGSIESGAPAGKRPAVGARRRPGPTMQRPDENKRRLITETAARLFAQQPYHKVRLDDIAAAARIGKGTLYIYFDNKEDLYFSLIYGGFAQLVDALQDQLAAGGQSPTEALERIVGGLVGFAFGHPHFFELIREVGAIKGPSQAEWKRKRAELQALIERTIRRGNDAGELADPQPGLTAACLGGMVRSLMLFGPKGLTEAEAAAYVLRLLRHGIAAAGNGAGASGPGKRGK